MPGLKAPSLNASQGNQFVTWQGGFPTSGVAGTPLLESTTVIPGSSPSLPSTPDYINLLNQLNLGAQQRANVGRIPGEQSLEEKSSGNIAQELAGQLPQDVLNLIQQQGAERGVAMGSPGSPNAEAAVLRALGLTSLEQQERGQRDLSAAAARNPVAPLVNLTGMLLTPYEAGELNVRGQQNLSNLGGLNAPAPYTGPGSGAGYFQAMPGGSATPTNWWQDIQGGGAPAYQSSPAGQMSDQEFNAWQDYVMGGGQEPGGMASTSYGTTSGVPEFDPTLLDWFNPSLDAGNFDLSQFDIPTG